MKVIRVVVVAVAPYVALVLLLASSVDGTPTLEMAELAPGRSQGRGPNNNWCVPQNDRRVHAVVSQLESTGLRCSPEPGLTDHIVFQHRESLDVEIVTFEKASTLAGNGLGWLQSFCISPN